MKMQPSVRNQLPIKNKPIPTLLTVGLGLFLYCVDVSALNWTITPSVQLRETYSDNVKLLPSGNEKSAFISELNPSVFATLQSSMSSMNLNYRLQNIYNQNGNDNLKLFNQLQYSSSTTLIPNKLFLSSTSTISQQNLNPNSIGVDNISGSNNIATVSTFNISPQWQPRFGNYVNGSVGVNFNTVTFDKPTSTANTALNTTLSNVSDSFTLAEMIQLTTGSAFKRVNLSVGFNNSESYRKGGDDVIFRSLNATLTTYLTKKFNVFSTIGETTNSYSSLDNNSSNGFFYTFGGQWNPSTHYSITAGVGNISYITFNVSPIQRLSWVTTLRDSSVGLNSGQTWQTAFNYQTRRSMWSLSHNYDTTTAQAIAQTQNAFNNIGNPTVGIGNNYPDIATNYNDEVVAREIWNLSASFFTGKSTITASAFDEIRGYQKNGSSQEVRGITGTWNWLVGSKTSLYLRSLWQQTDGDSSNTSASNHYDISIGIIRPISNFLNASIELRHIEQNYNNQGMNKPLDLNNGTGDYQENRATASLFMRF